MLDLRKSGGGNLLNCRDLTRKMLRTTYWVILIASMLNISCSGAKGKEAKEELPQTLEQEVAPRPLPDGAVAFDYAGHLYFDVVLRDTIPARMIFDTGNTNILFDTQFFKDHFAPSPTLQRTLIQGAGNSLEAAYRDVAEWEYSVGATTITEQGATVLDLRKILGYQVDGMFGMEFMRGRRVEFNYADGYMLLLPQDAALGEGYVCVKCKWLDQRAARMVMPLSIKINDGLSFDGNFLVDMGSSGSVSINSSLVAKLRLNSVLTDVRKKIYDTGGVGGSRTDYLFEADRVSVAGNDLLNVRMNYSGNTQGMMASDSYDGLVGNGLLEHFDVIIDFAKCEIWLRPNRNFNSAKRYNSGMTLTPQADGWIVNGLLEGGNAQLSGVKRGDLITSINGLKPNEVDIKRLKAMDASAGEWSLEVKRGDATSRIKFEKEE